MKGNIVIYVALLLGAAESLKINQGPMDILNAEPLANVAPSMPSVIQHLKLWHMALVIKIIMVAVAILAFRRRRRLTQEEDANVKSGLALLWALSNKDITSRLGYFTKRRSKETILRADNAKLNVQEFDDKTQKIASALLRGLVAKGETVMVCLPEGLDYYSVITACLRAGIPFVPVSPAMMQEKDQLQALISETKPGAVITSDQLNIRMKSMPFAQSMRRITTTDLEKEIGEIMRIRAPKGSDVAVTIFNGSNKSGPTTVSFSQQNIWSMVDSWLQAGMHSKAVASAFDNHTDITAISFFLGTVCSGAQYVVAGAAKPSLKAVEAMGLSHGLLCDAAQGSFDFTSMAKQIERTLFVTTPTAVFVDACMTKNVKVRAVHATPLQCGGISGVATKVQVLREELQQGVIKYLSMTQRLKAGTKVGTQPDSVTFVSQGLLQDNVDLLIRRGEQCVEDDMVGAIYTRSSLQASGVNSKNLANFVPTGEYGFISSKDLHLYITAGLGDSIMLDNRCIAAAAMEQSIASKNQIKQVAVFTVNMKDGSTMAAIAGEIKQTDDAKATVAKLQRFAQQEKLPLAAIALMKPGDMPVLPGSTSVSRADTKILFTENKLATVAGGSWKIVERDASAATDAPVEEQEINLDDVEAITFIAKGADKRGARQQEILSGAVHELQKMGVPATEKSDEFQLTSQQMAQASKRFERMLMTPESEWTKMGVAGDAAPWGEGICMRKEVELSAMLFLDTEGNVAKILEKLERQKFPTTKEVGAIVKAEPKLADAKYEGVPMNITLYRVLEVLGSLFVALIMGCALGFTVMVYNFLQTTPIAKVAFGLGFPIFMTSLSTLTICCKWTIIGKYQPCALARYSPAFYRWWVMDRLLETWEGFAACFFMETPFLVSTYRSLGADIDFSANLATCIREFDLVKIGADADITGYIITHLVTPNGVIMHKAHLGAATKVDSKAMVAPNCVMEDGSTLDKCEIAQAGSVIKAGPEPRQADRAAALRLQVIQAGLNLFCGLAFMAWFITPHATSLATTVRMSPVWTALGANASMEGPYYMDAMRWVCYYMVFLWTLGALLLVWSIAFKWIFIGKLKDGHVCKGVWWDMRVWMLNFWWTLSYMFFLQYWIDCSLLAITVYNAFGANVSYKTGLRFLQNMNPWHADFMTIKAGANMSNAKLHPATPEKRNVLKNIVLEENTFVGLMSLVQGGVTMGKGSAVATTTRCTKSLAPGQTLIGQRLMEGKKQDKDESGDLFESLSPGYLLLDLAFAMTLRLVVNAGFMFFLACSVTICFYAYDFMPIVFIIPLAFMIVTFFLGVVYAKTMEMLYHPRIVADLTIGQDLKANTWLQYLQALYLSQAYTFSMINGSALCALCHNILGADCPLDSQWYSTAIRDQCLLKVGHNSVIDTMAYLVGHVGQPGGVLSFKKSVLGDNCTLHPGAIILSGQTLKSGSTLDMWSHSHLEKVIPENKFYTGNPAVSQVNSRVNKLAATL